MRRFGQVLLGTFVATLALVALVRVAGELDALFTGLLCGLAASIPGSLAAVLLMGSQEAGSDAAAPQPYGPVLIMTGAPPRQPTVLPVLMPPANHEPSGDERRFRIIGEA